MIECLADADPNARLSAAFVLAEIGPAAKQAVTALTKTLKDRNSHVRHAAAEALWKIDPAASKRAGVDE